MRHPHSLTSVLSFEAFAAVLATLGAPALGACGGGDTPPPQAAPAPVTVATAAALRLSALAPLPSLLHSRVTRFTRLGRPRPTLGYRRCKTFL